MNTFSSVKIEYSSSLPECCPAPVSLPLSKSIAARALVAGYMACWSSGRGSEPFLNSLGIPECDDTLKLRSALDAVSDCIASGRGEIVDVNIGEGGTSLRFFMAVAASLEGACVRISGSERLMSRPLTPLVDALRAVGADIRIDGSYIHILGRQLKGGALSIDAGVSSQFVSALMLAAPSWSVGLSLQLVGKKVSRPYVEMTAAVMRRFGIDVKMSDNNVEVPPGWYEVPARFSIEPDWSAAAAVFEAALLSPEGRPIMMSSLTPHGVSLQGDAACAGLFERFGVTVRYHADGSAVVFADPGRVRKLAAQSVAEKWSVDMADTPDLVPYLVVPLALLGFDCRFTGVGHLRVKESDRLAALVENLAALGVRVECGPDWIDTLSDGSQEICRRFEHIVVNADSELPIAIKAFADHRIAMAFSLASALAGQIVIDDAGCVAKSFPSFWTQIKSMGYATFASESCGL